MDKRKDAPNKYTSILIVFVFGFFGVLLVGQQLNKVDDTPSASPTVAEVLDTYREVDGLFADIEGVAFVLVASERERDTQVNSVVMLTIADDVDLITTRDALWDVWSADAGALYDKRLVMDLTITQADSESIWQYTSDSTEWLQLQ